MLRKMTGIPDMAGFRWGRRPDAVVAGWAITKEVKKEA
jgi:hypothetical protein